MTSKRLSGFLIALVFATPAVARIDGDPHHWCGVTRGTLAAALGVQDDHGHDIDRVNRDRDPFDPAKSAIAAAARQEGDVAILEDDGTLFTVPNPVDIAGTAISFTPKGKKGYTVASSSAGLALPPPGDKLALLDDDVKAVTFPKGFKFLFFGKKYGQMLVHSDGNITFVAPDADSSARDLQRFLSGPPRIAPFFVDYNPETADEEGGVFVSTSKTAAVVTWYRVPQFGTTALSTFQVKLEKNGRITTVYGDLESDDAVAGITPGDGVPAQMVDYQSSLPVTTTSGIAEQFTTEEGLDDLAISNLFFRNFADTYDHLIVWLDFPHELPGNAFAYEFSVKNDIRGIGQLTFDYSRRAGSRSGRMSSFVQMGSLSRYPGDADQTFLGTNSTMDVLGQETGHRWLAFMRVHSPDNGDLLGRSAAHWNFNFDSDASDMEGNDIRDNGDGTFVTLKSTEGFSELDEYAMGLRPKEDVGPMFLVHDSSVGKGSAPVIGRTFRGNREDITIDDIIAAEGPRVPAAGSPQARSTFRMAFLLVTRAGEEPKPGSIEKVQRYASRWVSYFNQATHGLGNVEVDIAPQ